MPSEKQQPQYVRMANAKEPVFFINQMKSLVAVLNERLAAPGSAFEVNEEFMHSIQLVNMLIESFLHSVSASSTESAEWIKVSRASLEELDTAELIEMMVQGREDAAASSLGAGLVDAAVNFNPDEAN